MIDLYKFIDDWSANILFKYVAISVILLWLCTKFHMDINIIVFILLTLFIISYLNHKHISDDSKHSEIMEKKRSYLKPATNHIKKYDDIVDFLFSIQDFYHYGPIQYTHTVDKIDSFMNLYEICFIDKSTVFDNYGSLVQKKRDALNALLSITLSCDTDVNVHQKIHTAVKQLDILMVRYLDEISYLMDENIHKNGYNITTKIYDHKLKPYNEYTDIFCDHVHEIY